MDISELSFLQWHGIKLSSGLSQNMDKPASPAAKMQSTGKPCGCKAIALLALRPKCNRPSSPAYPGPPPLDLT